MPLFTRLLDWIGRLQLVQAMGQYAWSLLPVGWGVVTGGAGFITGQPLMWILVAVSISVAMICVSVFITSLMQERKNPEHKLKFVAPHVGFDLAKQKAGAASRRIDRAQLGCQFRNDATFPLSMIVEYADTDVEEIKPPREKYPKPAVLVGPGGMISAVDSRIEMNGQPCGPLLGNVDFRIHYGYPKNEKFSLFVRGAVSIAMDSRGAVTSILLANSPSEDTLPKVA